MKLRNLTKKEKKLFLKWSLFDGVMYANEMLIENSNVTTQSHGIQSVYTKIIWKLTKKN